jgi:hypothetical protein
MELWTQVSLVEANRLCDRFSRQKGKRTADDTHQVADGFVKLAGRKGRCRWMRLPARYMLAMRASRTLHYSGGVSAHGIRRAGERTVTFSAGLLASNRLRQEYACKTLAVLIQCHPDMKRHCAKT